MKKLLLFILISLTFVQSKAQSGIQYLSSNTGSGCYSIHYFNGHVYAGAGNTLMVYDTTGIPPHTQSWETRLKSNITNIKSRNNKLYVAANHAGISVWDLVDPAHPAFLYEFEPDSLNEAAYDMAFKGNDTLFCTLKKKMALLVDNGSSLQVVQRFAHQSDSVIVRGCDVKGNNLAFTTAYGNDVKSGVHIYDATTLTQKSFYPQSYCDPEDVIFGKNNALLNVLGGTQSWQNGDPHGLFYSLNITNPSTPTLNFIDTLPGAPYFAVAQPIRGQNINDTIYVATNSAQQYDNQIPPNGYVFVYDCHDTSNVHLLTTINQGLWHFDLAIGGKKMYVASEWYGIKTIRINNIFAPVDLGKTLTGGWNCSADKYHNRMVVANEGYGFKLYDITDLYNPVLIDTSQSPNFCYGTSFSKNGNYIFGYFYTGDDFRVFDANTLNLVGSMPVNSGLTTCDWFDTQVWQDYAIARESPSFSGKKIFIADVSNPLVPTIDTQWVEGQMNDLHVSPSGKIFIANNGSIKVFDIATHTMKVNLSLPLQNVNAIAWYNDTLYANVTGLSPGLRKYYYNGATTLTQLSTTPIFASGAPKFLAADAFGLYASFQDKGLYSYNRVNYTQTGYHKHGMEFYRKFHWGQQMLICKDSLVIISEYMGQTSLLSNYDNLATSIADQKPSDFKKQLLVFPNPSNGKFSFRVPEEMATGKMLYLKIYDPIGRLVQSVTLKAMEENQTVSLKKESRGAYYIQLSDGKTTYNAKVIKE